MTATVVDNQVLRKYLQVDQEMSKNAQQTMFCKDGIDKRSYNDIVPGKGSYNVKFETMIRNQEIEIENIKTILHYVNAIYDEIEKINKMITHTKEIVGNYATVIGPNGFPLIENTKRNLDALYNIFNTKIDGKYAFSGSKINLPGAEPTYVPNISKRGYINSNYYNGDNYQQRAYIDGIEIKYGLNANDKTMQRLIACMTMMLNNYNTETRYIDHTLTNRIVTLINDLPDEFEEICTIQAHAVETIRQLLDKKERDLVDTLALYGAKFLNGASDEKKQDAAFDYAIISNEIDITTSLIESNNKMFASFLSKIMG